MMQRMDGCESTAIERSILPAGSIAYAHCRCHRELFLTVFVTSQAVEISL